MWWDSFYGPNGRLFSSYLFPKDFISRDHILFPGNRMILSINVVYFLLDYEGAKDYDGPCLKLEAVIMKVPSLKLNAVIMKVPMIMKVPT